MSRESELGTRGVAQGGFLELGQTFVHVGAGDLFESTDVYASFDSINEFSDFDSTGLRKDRLWMLGLFGTTSDAADFQFSFSGLLYQDPERPLVLAIWALPDPPLTAAGDSVLATASTGDRVVPEPNFPIFFPPGSRWATVSASDNAGTTTTRIFSRWWAGPQGTTPPGMY